MKKRLLAWTARQVFANARGYAVMLIVCEFIVKISGVVSIFFLSGTIDTLIQVTQQEATVAAFVVWCSIYLLTGIFIPNAFRPVVEIVSNKTILETQKGIVEQIMKKAEQIPLDTLERPEYQDMLARANSINSGMLVDFFKSLMGIIFGIIKIATLFGVLLSFHWVIPVVSLGSFGIGLLIDLRLSKRQVKHDDALVTNRRESGYMHGLLTDSSGLKEVMSYEAWDYIYKRLSDKNHQIMRRVISFEKLKLRYAGISSSLSETLYLVGVVFRLVLLFTQQITIGMYTSVRTTTNQLMDATRGISGGISNIARNSLYIQRLVEFLDQPDEPNGNVSAHDGQQGFKIEFQDVSFIYPGSDMPALSHVSFVIQPGEKIALVGENGSGKSTLIRLLCRLSLPTEGKILIDGVDLSEYDKDTYFKRIAPVFQDYNHYFLTVSENITISELGEEIDAERMIRAAQDSDADNFIRQMENGYDQQLGTEFSHGTGMSGGQWQRLSMARAYYVRASLMLMDEPTAALDPMAEVRLYEHFAKLARGNTAIMISHRLGISALADCVLFLQDGELKEIGKHEELLLQPNGAYAMLYNLQAQWYT